MKRKPDIYKYDVQEEIKDNKKIEQLQNQINAHSSFINDIYKNPTNNILITNLWNRKNIKDVVNNHKDQLNYITFKMTNQITDFNIKDLNIIKKNDYIDLVKLVWGTNEIDLVKIFKNFNITSALSENCYISNIFAANNNIIHNIFNIKKNNENRNALNTARCETLDHNLSNKNYYQGEKHLFLSEIIIKKYVFFFYNHDTKEIESTANIYLYEYFLKCLKNYDYRDLKTIIKDAERKFAEINETDEQYKEISKLRDLLQRMFNNQKFRFKSIIEEIKNYFNDNNDIKTYDIVQYAFINDLINMGLNFDFNVMVHQYNKLPDDIKIKYEIKHNKNKMILSYKRHILDKLIKSKKEKALKHILHKKNSPFIDPIILRFISNKNQETNQKDKNEDTNGDIINKIENINLNDEQKQNNEQDNLEQKNKSKEKDKNKNKKHKKKNKERTKSKKKNNKDKDTSMSENDEQEIKEKSKSKKKNNKDKDTSISENDDQENDLKRKANKKKKKNKNDKSTDSDEQESEEKPKHNKDKKSKSKNKNNNKKKKPKSKDLDN